MEFLEIAMRFCWPFEMGTGTLLLATVGGTVKYYNRERSIKLLKLYKQNQVTKSVFFGADLIEQILK